MKAIVRFACMLPMAAAMLLWVSCTKPLNEISITTDPVTGYTIAAGQTLEIPFTLGELSGFTATAEVVSSDENYPAEVKISSDNPEKGTVTIVGPSLIFSAVDFTVDLTVEDAANSRVSKKQFKVTSIANVQTITSRANCFIVAPGSIVMIPTCMGNSSTDVELDSVEFLWQDNDNLVASAFAYGTKNIVVKFNEGMEGNASVAARKEVGKESKTVWSWTFWVTADTPKDVTVGSFTFMDRNIGALNLTPGSKFSNGNLYQWGRKDAFAGADDQCALKKMYSRKGEEVERAKATVDVVDNIDNAVANPFTHYYNVYPTSAGNYSWITNDVTKCDLTKVAALWGNGASKTVNDPCPEGYRVASQEAWAAVAAQEMTLIFDENYTPSEEVQAKWYAKYKDMYLVQSRFRGAKCGNLTVLGSGELTHQLTFSNSFGAASTNITSTCWTDAADGKMLTEAKPTSYFRGMAAKLSYSGSSKKAALSSTSTFNFAYELPVRCIKESK